MEIEYAKICEKGLSREENQDAVFTCKTSEMAFFLVADGMGGHSHGEEASQMLVMACAEWCKCFSERKYESDFSKMISTIRKMLMDTNQKVREEHKGSVCGAVFVLLFVYRKKYAVFSSGDARVYFNQFWRYQKLTLDEVWENQMERTKQERENLQHPFRGRLVNAFGVKVELKVRVLCDQIAGRGVFLLCSDGLYKMCPEKYLKRQVQKAGWGVPIEKVIKQLRRTVYQNGAKDNLSIVLVKIL